MASGYHSFLALTIVLIFLCVSRADIKRECRRESKVSWAALKRFRSGDLEQNDPKLKCYLKCFMVRHGIMDKNAEVDVARALRHLPASMQDSSKKLLDKCKSVNGTDPCDKAYQMVKCSVGSQPGVLRSLPLV